MDLSISNPYSLKEVGRLKLQTAEDAETALRTARALFDDRRQWLPAPERIAILERTAALMTTQLERLIRIAVEEGGKPHADSKAEVLRAIDGVKIAAASIAQIAGEQIPMGLNAASASRMAFTCFEPVGVVVSISAFNHPLNLIVHQTVTAIAAGCPVIVKPARTTPLSCLNFVEILYQAGLPRAWCQPLVCDSAVAEKLATDPRIGFVSFIGSARVGWALRSKLAPGVRCALEHGGVAPVIVDKDAELDVTVPALLKGGFYHAGQVCVSVQRIYVEHSIVDALLAALVAGAQGLRVGDPLDPATEVGPLITPQEVDRVAAWVDEAVAGGAALLCGGRRISASCYAPTVLLNPPADARVSTQEIFGPVVCVYPYTDRAQAIAAANALDVHFQAAVFTQNLDVALDCIKQLNASSVMVNDHSAFRVDWMPFGGRDASGLGMGGIGHSIRDMLREKLMVFKSRAL